ncbi:unnamed protein product [Cunninghamella blakesleeana]
MSSTTSLSLIRVMEPQLSKYQLTTLMEEEYESLLAENKEKYNELCQHNDYIQKQLKIMKRENTNLMKTQQRLETQIYAQDHELQEAKKEIALLTRKNKELETRLENESQNYEADRLTWHQTEIELANTIKKKNNHPRRTRSATASNVFATSNVSNHFGSPFVSSSTSLLQTPMSPLKEMDDQHLHNDRKHGIALTKIQSQEKLIKSLTDEIDAQKKANFTIMQNQAEQLDSLRKEVHDMKLYNLKLMEDNEGYQILLREKTISGEFLKKMEHQEVEQTLATEINKITTKNDETYVQELQEEIKTLKESNKALSLYMNKILLRIVGNNELVDVLNIDEADIKDSNQNMNSPLLKKPQQQQGRSRRSTFSTFTNSNTKDQEKGWTKALKRMSVIGWSNKNNHPILTPSKEEDDMDIVVDDKSD